ncbi:MAG: S8 family serine peptidase [Pirellulaceae bacterium]
MKPALNKSASKRRALRKSLSQSQERRRFRQMMFESLEGRALLAGVEIDFASWQGSHFVPGEMMVRFNSDISQSQAANALFFSGGATITRWWQELHLAEVKLPTGLGATTPTVQLNYIQNINNLSSVYYAEPNFIRDPQRTPNDPGFGQQWGHENTGQAVNPNPFPIPPGLFPGTVDADTDVTDAWDITTGSPSTIIAIIDTGVDYRHADLAANIWTNPGEAPDGIDNDGNGYIDDIFGWNFADNNNDPDDLDSHGTHVAGIAGAVGNNGIGVSGVNWNSKIMSLKAGNPTFSVAAIAGAQLYIAKMRSQFGFNIVVSNNSYGANGPFSFTEYDTIRTAINAGIPFVAAAGNGATNNDILPHFYPNDYDLAGIIGVASSDNNDQLSSFSQYGLTTVDLAAPGEQILSTVPPLGVVPPIFYDYFDGTSMASPMVAGAVGLLRSLDPSLSVAQVKSALLNGVDRNVNLSTRVLSGGRLNIAKSLDLVPRNEIHGNVFEDVDGNKAQGAGESGVPAWTVYLDRNNNGALDAGEPNTTTLADGSYNLRGVFGPGTFTVREVIQPRYTQTLPTANGGYSVSLANKTTIVTNITFGVRQLPGEVHGRKWNDINGDGVMDATEPGLPGIIIYVDVNNDGKIALGEPGAETDSQGYYTILNVPPGTYAIREVYAPGFLQTFPDPAGTDKGAITGVVVTKGDITPGINFGNKAAFDYGDAPAPYPTLISKTGAYHSILQGFYLGSRVDAETNGVPSVSANGDDLNAATNDEDGVTLSNLVPGQTATATVKVTAASGNITSGYLQGFIDFNKDGDWLDSGEQVLTNQQLSTGTHALTFPVPSNAGLGATYGRFRFSINPGISSKGIGLGGEVEDYLINILGQNPTALPDAVTVDNDSLLFQNPIYVLANDLPSASGPAGIDPTFLDLSSTQGQVVLDDNGTPGNLTDDFFRYQPPATFVGIDTFKYRDRDPNGNVSTPALVTITVQFVPRDPIAVDNTFDVLVNSSANKMDVLANDVQGTGGAVRFSTSTPPTALHGTVTLDTNSTAILTDDFYRYTPTPGFQGSDSFSYTIIDSLNKISTAKATVQVLSAARTPYVGTSPAIIKFELQVVDKATGLVLPDGALIPLGTSILVRGVITDLRGTVIDPISLADYVGAFSGYMDLLYDRTKVQPFGPIVFGPQFQDAKAGAGGTPGLIDEIGSAYSGTQNSSGPSPVLVFTKEFLTTAAGPLQFVANPADASPEHDITAFKVDGGDPNFYLQAIPSTEIYYQASFPNISILGSGEGDDTNLWLPVDVNQDGKITPIDALLVVNYLNEQLDAAGSGEGSTIVYKRDVNHDNQISPIDALMVINALNRAVPAVPAGEGEADDSSSRSPLVMSTTGSGGVPMSSASTSAEAPAVATYASNVDQIFAQTDWTKPSVSRIEDSSWSKPEVASEDLFAGLGTSVRRNRKG